MRAVDKERANKALDRLEAVARDVRERADAVLDLVSFLRGIVRLPDDGELLRVLGEGAAGEVSGETRSLLDVIQAAGPMQLGDGQVRFPIIYRDEDGEYSVGHRAVCLTWQEKAVMDVLRLNATRFSSRAAILAALQTATSRPKPGTVDVLIFRLRKKFKEAGSTDGAIRHSRGRGWTLAPGVFRPERPA